MPTLIFKYQNGPSGSENQVWLRGTSAAGELWSPVISGIPSGAIINSAKLTFAQGHIYTPPGLAAIYQGTARNDDLALWLVYGGNGYNNTAPTEVDVSSYITGNGSYNLYFYKTAASNGNQSNVYFDAPTITVEYTDPTSACGSPTTCKVSVTLTHNATTLSWSGATAGTNNAITGYEVQRCESSDGKTWGSWAALTTTTATSLSVSPPATYGNYYKYRVRTRGAAGSSFYSAWKESTNTLRRDHAPLAAFTDPSLTAGSTSIKAIHMTELHDRVNTLRVFYGLGNYSFTPIVAGQTSLAGWANHVAEIRDAVDAIGKSHDAWIAITQNTPSVAVMQQLRNVVLAI